MSFHDPGLLAFKRVPILSSFTDEEIFDFVRLCRVRNVGAGHTLFRQGEEGRSLFIIGEGALDVYLERGAGREHIAEYGAWDVVGEVALLDPAPRSATVIARESSVLYEVLGEDFEKLLLAYHPAAFKVVRGVSRLVCKRIRSANLRIEAELTGAAAPPPYTGEFERVRESATHASVQPEGTQREAPSTSGPMAKLKRVLGKLWAPESP